MIITLKVLPFLLPSLFIVKQPAKIKALLAQRRKGIPIMLFLVMHLAQVAIKVVKLAHCHPRMVLSGIQVFQAVRIWIPAQNHCGNDKNGKVSVDKLV
jgi:hypothetical protein